MACSKLAASTQEQWRKFVTSLYPDVLTKTYCVPAPFNFNKVPYRRETVPGTAECAFVLHDPSVSAPSGSAPSGSAPSGSAPPAQPAPGTSHGLSAPQVMWSQESPHHVPVTVQASDVHDDVAQNHLLMTCERWERIEKRQCSFSPNSSLETF
jgi:hypothetical protein